MKIEDLKHLYEYNYWASKRVASVCAKVTPEEFVAPGGVSYGSLRGTLVHIMDTERGWRMICQHGELTPDAAEADFPTLEFILSRWREEEASMRAYLAGLTDRDLAGIVRYTTEAGVKRERVLWHCLFHVVNHGTHHRGEAATVLRQFHQTTGGLDFPVFLNDTARGA